MKAKVLAFFLGVLIGAGGVFGVFAFQEYGRIQRYKTYMSGYAADDFAASPLDAGELYDLPLVGPDGRPAPSMRESSKKVVFLSFWATWCKPCLDEFGSLEALRREVGNDVAFYFLSSEAPEVIRPVAEEFDLPMYSYGSEESLPGFFRAGQIPRSYILVNGVLRYQHWGPAPWDGEKSIGLLRALVKEAPVG